jgi:hypothetical protein
VTETVREETETIETATTVVQATAAEITVMETVRAALTVITVEPDAVMAAAAGEVPLQRWTA